MKKVLEILKNAGVAIIKGQLLLRLDAGKFFPHIIYTFIVFSSVIWVSLCIDETMAKVENSKKELKEARIRYTDKVFELSSMERRASVSKMLLQMGSAVQEPEKPTTEIER